MKFRQPPTLTREHFHGAYFSWQHLITIAEPWNILAGRAGSWGVTRVSTYFFYDAQQSRWCLEWQSSNEASITACWTEPEVYFVDSYKNFPENALPIEHQYRFVEMIFQVPATGKYKDLQNSHLHQSWLWIQTAQSTTSLLFPESQSICGVIARIIDIPADWDGHEKDIYLHWQGAVSMYVADKSEDMANSKNPGRISYQQLRVKEPGKNVLVKIFFRWSTGFTYLECQDFLAYEWYWTRVFCIHDLSRSQRFPEWKSTLDDSYKNGIFGFKCWFEKSRKAALILH